MSKGRLFILSGPSGSGKDTILGGVFQRLPEVRFSISCVSRPMRPGEQEGDKYHFVSREEFEQMIAEDGLLEHNCYVGNYYGTPKKPVEEAIRDGADMIVEIDVNGADQIRAKTENTVSIFILPPSVAVLRERLINRGSESPDKVEQRMKEALVEISRASDYDYIVVNDRLEDAIDDVVRIIEADRLSKERFDFANYGND
ncbi:MAG: guanylate kinase [Clostridia bacterium]|nr:guanylate kinase [Clostridia bacterium]